MYAILDPAGLREKKTYIARIVIKTNHKLCKSRLKADNVMYKVYLEG